MIADLKPYSEYKESGVPWLGRVPLHWNVYAFRNFPRPQRGRQPKNLISSPSNDNDCLPYLTMEYLRTTAGKPKVYAVNDKDVIKAKKEDIILLWDGANAGEVLRAKEGIVCSTSALIPSGSFDNHFFYYILKQCEPCLRAFSVGMGVPHVDNDILKSVLIALPPAIEQRSIARFLNWATEWLDKVIHGNKKTMKLLIEHKQQIIQNAVIRGLNPATRLKPSGIPWLGEIPHGWEIKRAKYIYREVNERSINGDEELLSVSHLTGVTPRSQKNVTMYKAKSYVGHKLCQPGDLVVNTMWAWAGALGVSKISGIVSPSYAVYRPLHQDRNMGEYISHLLRTTPYLSNIICCSTGVRASRLRLYPEEFLKLPIIQPPLEEQIKMINSIIDKTRRLDSIIDHLEREIDSLREYRTRLIADIVTGKLDVRDAAAHLPSEASGSVDDTIDIDEVEDVTDLDDEEAEA